MNKKILVAMLAAVTLGATSAQANSVGSATNWSNGESTSVSDKIDESMNQVFGASGSWTTNSAASGNEFSAFVWSGPKWSAETTSGVVTSVYGKLSGYVEAFSGDVFDAAYQSDQQISNGNMSDASEAVLTSVVAQEMSDVASQYSEGSQSAVSNTYDSTKNGLSGVFELSTSGAVMSVNGAKNTWNWSTGDVWTAVQGSAVAGSAFATSKDNAGSGATSGLVWLNSKNASDAPIALSSDIFNFSKDASGNIVEWSLNTDLMDSAVAVSVVQLSKDTFGSKMVQGNWSNSVDSEGTFWVMLSKPSTDVSDAVSGDLNSQDGSLESSKVIALFPLDASKYSAETGGLVSAKASTTSRSANDEGLPDKDIPDTKK